MIEELLPCPFCGGKASWASDESLDDWIPQCTAEGCWCMLGAYATEAEAIDAWNRRAAPVWPEVYVTPQHIVDGTFGTGSYLNGADAIMGNPPYADEIVRVPIIGTLDASTRIPQP